MKIEILSLHHDGQEIPWALFEPENADKEYVVLWLQGWSATIERHREGVERMAKQTGTTFAMLDYAGHGANKVPLEQSTKLQQLDEVVAVYDELSRRGYQHIIAIGGSFGAYMAALLSDRRKVHALVLRAPANYEDDMFELPHARTLPEKERPVDSMATEAVGKFDGFVYVMEHELDQLVPRKMPRRYFDVAKLGNYLIIPKTPHSPKQLKDAQAHFDYIELYLRTIIEGIKLQDGLGSK
jgi:pimeloyl-ACP methyl ester carboxylesterase